MRTRQTLDLAVPLDKARRRFERWRQRRRGRRARIPERLWASAVRAAQVCGLCRTAQTLRLDYAALKKRLKAAAAHCASAEESAVDRRWHAGLPTGRRRRLDSARNVSGGEPLSPGDASAFFELKPAGSSGAATAAATVECLLELEDPGGAKLRIHLKGGGVPDLAALCRSFREDRP